MIKEKIAKLISVKSIVTISLTGVFCYLAITGKIDGAQFLGIFTMVVGFYFGIQTTRETKEKI